MPITGDDLKTFGAQNGLLIHPSKDPDEWARIINANNGICNCDPNRTCPCEQAISEVHNESMDPKFRRCCCTFYVSQTYLDEYGYTQKQKAKKTSAKQSAAKSQPDITPPVDEVTEKINDIISRVKDAKDQIDKEAYDDSIETLAAAVEDSGCEVCEQILVPEMVHVEYIKGLCQVDSDACAKELKNLKTRLDTIVDFYNKALPASKSETLASESESSKSEPQRSEYHQCLKDMLTSKELETYAKPLKFYIASKVCSGKAGGVDDALSLASKEHPEWF